jgi:hypothetical protein
MKDLFEYLISAAFAVLLIGLTYNYFATTLVDLITTAFEGVVK